MQFKTYQFIQTLHKYIHHHIIFAFKVQNSEGPRFVSHYLLKGKDNYV